jgi:predicted transcriptional regulator
MGESIVALEGVFDLIRHISLEKMKDFKGEPRCEVKVKTMMTKNVFSLGMESSLLKAAEVMIAKNISSVIVVDPDGLAQGVLSQTDLARFYKEKSGETQMIDLQDEKIASWMSSGVLSVFEDDGIDEASDLMLKHNIHRVYVKKKDEIVGVLSAIDILIMYSKGSNWNDEESKKVDYFPHTSEVLRVHKD